MSYDQPRPFGFSIASAFDSAEAVWVDPGFEAITFGEEPRHIDADGIAEEIAADRARKDARRRRLARVEVPGAPLLVVPLSTVAMKSIVWLERPLWQGSAFQLLAGPKGAGKGTYLAGLAARISRKDSQVLFVASEDSVAIDLKPRLVAAGATIEHCHVIPEHVRLPDDVGRLRELAEGIGDVGLLVIDPVANHIGARNSNSDAEVRDAISPLNKLADELGCLIVGVRHPGKDRSRGALASILGSTAWVDTPRAVVMIAADDEDERLRHIQVVAGNRSLGGAAQAFRIDAVEVAGLTEPITLAVPLGESAKSVDELLARRERGPSKSNDARELILDILEGEGEQESDALDARVARETGLAAKTIRNTRSELAKEGLVKPHPEKDEFGSVERWIVRRTQAPRDRDPSEMTEDRRDDPADEQGEIAF